MASPLPNPEIRLSPLEAAHALPCSASGKACCGALQPEGLAPGGGDCPTPSTNAVLGDARFGREEPTLLPIFWCLLCSLDVLSGVVTFQQCREKLIAGLRHSPVESGVNLLPPARLATTKQQSPDGGKVAEGSTIENRTRRAEFLVQLGELSSARQALEGASLASRIEETLKMMTNETKRLSRPRELLPRQVVEHVPATPFDLVEKIFLRCQRFSGGRLPSPPLRWRFAPSLEVAAIPFLWDTGGQHGATRSKTCVFNDYPCNKSF